VSQKILAQSPAGAGGNTNIAGRQQATTDANTAQQLYTKYMAGSATAPEYIQLQQLLKKYKIG
jgi:hypothetical protein